VRSSPSLRPACTSKSRANITLRLSRKRYGPRWLGRVGGAYYYGLPCIACPDYKRGGHEQEQATLVSYRGVGFPLGCVDHAHIRLFPEIFRSTVTPNREERGAIQFSIGLVIRGFLLSVTRLRLALACHSLYAVGSTYGERHISNNTPILLCSDTRRSSLSFLVVLDSL
jgi:hypothetical protein